MKMKAYASFDDLRQASTKIGEAMYQSSSSQQAPGGADGSSPDGEPAGAGAKKDGDTIEGEFKES